MVGSTPPRAAPCRTCGESFRDDILICPHDGAHLPLEGRLLDGKFRLDKRLGHGGMATVWQATNEFIERPVAIKLMHSRYAEDADLLARFRNEATAAGRIGSPHICDVLDFGRSAIGPYIVMELLSGCALGDLIEAHGRLQPGLAVWILRQALDGLDAAHRAGIVHRDLKPENIYLCRAIRDQWLVKLMDFGISKFVDSMRTGAGTMMGSPNYMAPEQILGAANVDARADVWSIGAIFFEALTGQQAFARDSIADSLAAVRGYDPPPIHTLVPEVAPGLSEIVARCLRKQPDQRWPSAHALAEALLPHERPGPRARLMPTTPIGDPPRGATTLPRTVAAPRALAEAETVPVPNARPQPARAAPDDRSSGPYPPVPNARSTGPQRPVPRSLSGPYPPVASAKSTGPHPPVPSARSTGPHQPVPSARSTGPHQPVPNPESTGPHQPVPNPKSTGPHQPVPNPKSTGPHQPVPNARSNAPHQPVPKTTSDPRPTPAAQAARAPVPSASPRARAVKPAAEPHPLLIVAFLAAIGATAAAIAWFAL